MSRTAIIENGGFPILVETDVLLGSPAPRRKAQPPLRPRPIGKQVPAGYTDAPRAALDLSCEVGEVESIAAAEGIAQIEGEGGAILFSVADIELAADRRRPSRPLSASALTPDDSRAGERLADAAKRLGVSEDELTAMALGKVTMTVSDGEVYLRSRDLKRIEREQGLDKQAKARSAPSPLAPAPSDSATEERTAAAARALGIADTMQGSEARSASGTAKANRERTRIGKPRRWSTR